MRLELYNPLDFGKAIIAAYQEADISVVPYDPTPKHTILTDGEWMKVRHLIRDLKQPFPHVTEAVEFSFATKKGDTNSKDCPVAYAGMVYSPTKLEPIKMGFQFTLPAQEKLDEEAFLKYCSWLDYARKKVPYATEEKIAPFHEMDIAVYGKQTVDLVRAALTIDEMNVKPTLQTILIQMAKPSGNN